MASAEERLKILTLIQEGKITPQEGIRLLESLDVDKALKETAPAAPPRPGGGPRWLRVRVTDTNSGKVRVNIRLPINVIHAGIKMGARFAPEVEGLDTSQLMDWINSGVTGQVVDVFDDQDGEHVEVYLE